MEKEYLARASKDRIGKNQKKVDRTNSVIVPNKSIGKRIKEIFIKKEKYISMK